MRFLLIAVDARGWWRYVEPHASLLHAVRRLPYIRHQMKLKGAVVGLYAVRGEM